MIELFDHEKFRAWLNKYAPGDIVGYQGEIITCPMAKYLHEIGHPDALVGMIGSTVRGKQCTHPYWVQRFIHHIDATYDDLVDPDEITAARALHCLNLALSEMLHKEPHRKLAADRQVDQPSQT